MKQLVSILIPAFNSAKWIASCIESALEQNWPKKEIIVVDDGSKDATFLIARKYSSRIVKVITQEHRGAAAARNHALLFAQGDYIQWLDADDLLAPDKISRQLDGAEDGKNSRVLLSGSWGRFYYIPEKSKFRPNPLWEDLEPKEWLFRKIDQNLWMPIESWLVSRKLTEMAGPWDESLSLDDDGEYFCRVLLCSTRIKFIPDSRCYCRMSNFSLSHPLTLNERKLESLLVSIFSYIKRLRVIEDSQRTRDASLKLLNRWSFYFYPERTDLIQQMQLIAKELGGELRVPELRKKYRWIQKILGWKIAKKAQYVFPTVKFIIKKNLERIF